MFPIVPIIFQCTIALVPSSIYLSLINKLKIERSSTTDENDNSQVTSAPTVPQHQEIFVIHKRDTCTTISKDKYFESDSKFPSSSNVDTFAEIKRVNKDELLKYPISVKENRYFKKSSQSQKIFDDQNSHNSEIISTPNTDLSLNYSKAQNISSACHIPTNLRNSTNRKVLVEINSNKSAKTNCKVKWTKCSYGQYKLSPNVPALLFDKN